MGLFGKSSKEAVTKKAEPVKSSPSAAAQKKEAPVLKPSISTEDKNRLAEYPLLNKK